MQDPEIGKDFSNKIQEAITEKKKIENLALLILRTDVHQEIIKQMNGKGKQWEDLNPEYKSILTNQEKCRHINNKSFKHNIS